VLTLAMAWPVVMSPASRIFGTELDGRHHDPFTVMRQFEHGPPPFPYRQPLVDDVGGIVARVTGPVAAFNLLVLITFPLTVLTTFLLARYLGLSHAGSMLAGFAFAFAPPHLAHAAYHPHIAQTQWIPLYLLALWAVAERVTAGRLACWALAAVALALSNWYAAFICAVLTPVALVKRGQTPFSKRGLSPFRKWGLSPFFFGALAFPAADLARYGAQWFAYGLPAADHVLWGAGVRSFWDARGMTGAIVEQQVSVSWALAGLAVYGVRTRRRYWPLALVALVAAWCSLAPPPGTHPWWIPSTWLYPVLPMFRAYARFAFVTHLMVALLAGVGLMRLLERGPDGYGDRRRTVLAFGLLLVAAFEYAPLPARARDVLPTAAHRWIADRADPGRVLDCVSPGLDNAHVGWLMQREITSLPASLPSCHEQQAASRAATLGYRYAIVRHGTAPSELPAGFVLVRDFPDAAVYDIVAPVAPATVSAIEGFHALERDSSQFWRWMSAEGRWSLQAPSPKDATLELQLSSFERPRRLAVSLNAQELAVLEVDTVPGWYRLPGVRLERGRHVMDFRALEAASPALPPDSRELSIRLHDWRWR